jgi:hypothetical protein
MGHWSILHIQTHPRRNPDHRSAFAVWQRSRATLPSAGATPLTSLEYLAAGRFRHFLPMMILTLVTSKREEFFCLLMAVTNATKEERATRGDSGRRIKPQEKKLAALFQPPPTFTWLSSQIWS